MFQRHADRVGHRWSPVFPDDAIELITGEVTNAEFPQEPFVGGRDLEAEGVGGSRDDFRVLAPSKVRISRIVGDDGQGVFEVTHAHGRSPGSMPRSCQYRLRQRLNSRRSTPEGKSSA